MMKNQGKCQFDYLYVYSRSFMIPYNSFAKHLKENKIIATPAELHGHLTGMLVVDADLKLDAWLNEFFQDYSFDEQPDIQKSALVFESFFDYVLSELKSDSFSFKLLLPDDNVGLSERLQALAMWCHSFMIGLAFAGLKSDSHLPAEAKEFLVDLEKISKVDSDVDETQGEEADFIELTEYLKAGVITLFEDFRGMNQAINPTIQ